MTELPRLYTELAPWFPILTAPEEYAHEASRYRGVFELTPPPRTLLELGSGGGNNASHLKARFEMTLVDLSPGMLEVSRRLNPECEHLQGDMRSVRLGRLFDAVFIHDAVMYLTSEDDLRRAMETAFVHTRPGAEPSSFPTACARHTETKGSSLARPGSPSSPRWALLRAPSISTSERTGKSTKGSWR